LKGGKPISYGARAINEGGYQSIPTLIFPGGALIGCSAGFLNLPKIKGSHTAMKSGMLAAESIVEELVRNERRHTKHKALYLEKYPEKIKDSWIHEELYKARNIKPAFAKWGMIGGVLYTGLDSLLLRGKAPWTLKHPHPDHEATKPKDKVFEIDYPKPDGVLTFDLLTNLTRSGVNHNENQPIHLKLKIHFELLNIIYQNMLHPKPDIVLLAFMKLLKKQMDHVFKSTLKIVFIAKHVISRTQLKISTGLPLKEEEDQLMEACENAQKSIFCHC